MVDLEAGTLTLYREKTDETQVHQLKRHTRLATQEYWPTSRSRGARPGRSLAGYQGKRDHPLWLYDRVRLAGGNSSDRSSLAP